MAAPEGAGGGEVVEGESHGGSFGVSRGDVGWEAVDSGESAQGRGGGIG